MNGGMLRWLSWIPVLTGTFLLLGWAFTQYQGDGQLAEWSLGGTACSLRRDGHTLVYERSAGQWAPNASDDPAEVRMATVAPWPDPATAGRAFFSGGGRMVGYGSRGQVQVTVDVWALGVPTWFLIPLGLAFHVPLF